MAWGLVESRIANELGIAILNPDQGPNIQNAQESKCHRC